MLLSDFSYEIYASVFVNKMRTSLTILGIVIGIGSVIAMVAIGKGAQISVQKSIEAIGANLIIVRPGAERGPGTEVRGAQGSAQSLTDADAAALSKMPQVATVAPEVSAGRSQVIAEGKNTNTSVTGVTVVYAQVRNVTLAQGSFFTPAQEQSLAKVAVLGPDVSTTLFGAGVNPVGQKVRIGSADFTVIGLAAARGGSGFGSSDDFVYIPLLTARQYFAGNQFLSNINLQVKEGEDMAAVAEQATQTLLTEHKISNPDEADFSVLNQEDIVSTASSITGTFTALLGAVAGISLVVGGIGIMNMMLTTVTERTREIGLRKAIGADRRDIRMQFLAEAITLTFIGGLIGVLLGWGVSSILNAYGISAEVTLSSVLLAFGVSALIGIVFGYYPAHRAAKLSPIEALRYE